MGANIRTFSPLADGEGLLRFFGASERRSDSLLWPIVGGILRGDLRNNGLGKRHYVSALADSARDRNYIVIRSGGTCPLAPHKVTALEANGNGDLQRRPY